MPAQAVGGETVLSYAPCRIGVWLTPEADELEVALQARVVRAELTRRLPCAEIADWSAGGQLDCVVALGAGEPPTPTDAAWSGSLVHLGGTATDPDPAFVLPRLFSPSVLARRLEYLRLMGWYPRDGGAVVVEVDGSAAGSTTTPASITAQVLVGDERLAVVTRQVAAGADGDDRVATATAGLEADGRVYRLPRVASQEDLAAAVQACSGMVASSRLGALMAFCYERPFVILDPRTEGERLEDLARVTGRDLTVDDPSQVVAALVQAMERPSSADELRDLQAEVDRQLDGIAGTAVTSYRDRVTLFEAGGVAGSRVRELEAQVAGLRRAYETRSRQLVMERVAAADQVGGLRERLERALSDADIHWRRSTAEAERRAVVEEELSLLRQTRTHRWTAVPRAAYARLRRRQ